MSVNVKETHRVKPTRPIQHSPMFLSNGDLLMPAVYVSMLYFFKNINNENKFMNFHKLYSSLEEILSDYYPLVGLLKKEDDGRSTIVCSDRGIPFVVAESPDITILQLEKNNWDTSLISNELIPVGMPDSVDSPLFAVQHTTLADGSVVLGVAAHHFVTDGCGLFNFMNNWGLRTRQEPIIPPVHDRTLSKATSDLSHDKLSISVPLKIPPLTKKLYYFSNENLKKLCNAYSGKNSNGDNDWVSTNDILVAHIWRIVTKSRGIPLDDQVICGVACNVRERLNPPLMASYFGNCTLGITTKMLVSELINGSRSNVARQIRNSITETNVEQRMKSNELNLIVRYYGNDFVVSNMSKLPLYELDFGYGTPFKCCNAKAITNGLVVILGTDKNEGLDVYISLITEHLQKLEQDPEFKEFQ